MKGIKGFQKGNKVWLGKRHTQSTKDKLSISKKGKPSKLKGRKLSKEFRKKLSESRKGIKFSKEHLKNLSLSHKGQKMGKLHHNWKGGVTPLNEQIRKSFEYKAWRRAVFERDRFRCIFGGIEHGNKIQADHIKPFSLFPELRFAIDNGRTLCVDCHTRTNTWGRHRKIKCLF